MKIDAPLLSALIAAVTLVVGVLSYRLNRKNINSENVWRRSEDSFLRARKEMRESAYELQTLALESGSRNVHDAEIPLLTREGWLPERPVELDLVNLRWDPPTEPRRALIKRNEQVTASYWPRGHEMADHYHSVIKQLQDPPEAAFFNGSCFRLVRVLPGDTNAAGPTLDFGDGYYFEALDTTDVLGFEFALRSVTTAKGGRAVRRRGAHQGAYRRWLKDPFALDKRVAVPGIDVLTIIETTTGPRFLLHQRGAKGEVATAQGLVHVIPAGEFQPRDLSRQARESDLDLWATVEREYAEELLGMDTVRGQPIDEVNDAVFQRTQSLLRDGRSKGTIRAYFLGIGLDPLSWKPEILAAIVFSESSFKSIFGEAVIVNDEGKIDFGDDRTKAGILFTEDEIAHRLAGRMLASGAACLTLAWRHREFLGLQS